MEKGFSLVMDVMMRCQALIRSNQMISDAFVFSRLCFEHLGCRAVCPLLACLEKCLEKKALHRCAPVPSHLPRVLHWQGVECAREGGNCTCNGVVLYGSAEGWGLRVRYGWEWIWEMALGQYHIIPHCIYIIIYMIIHVRAPF